MNQTPFDSLSDAPAEDRLAAAIAAISGVEPGRVAVVSGAGSDGRSTSDYGTLAAAMTRLEARLDAVRPAGIVARAARVESLLVIAAACGRQHVPVAFLAEDSRDLVGALRDWVELDDALELPPAPPGGGPRREFETVPPHVVVATSGTSGPPKLVEHSWDSLLAAARLAEQWHGLAWLLVYDATRWAGIQVWVQALLTGGRLVVPASRDPDTVARALVDERVAILPATPTLLRRLTSSADRGLLERVALDRITLGGEAADGPLLDRAHAAFPAARITQVYATTELGEVFRVSDVIVVGGAKVLPGRVEEVLRGVPGVAEARVYGLPSGVTGELVAGEIVLADPLPQGFTPDAVRSAALTACREAIEPHGVPRILDIVKRIATTAAGKTPRRPALAPHP
ncbi:MAG: long-chain fatty acid--CoA ligase [Planctomycetia bacterium]|nr:long-chain fatty acid--CoA ligase [Planctomycetia bacterium]